MPPDDQPGPNPQSFSKQQGNWRPILEEAYAEQALRAVRNIAERISEASSTDASTSGAGGIPLKMNCSLAGGNAGLALLYAYLAQQWPEEGFEQQALGYLDEAINALAEVPTDPSFYSGFTGVAWAVEHLQGRLLKPSDEDPNEGIDQALNVFLEQSPWPYDYDLVSGLVGLGVYALERSSDENTSLILNLVIDRLDEIAERTAEGVCWFTRPELLPPRQRDYTPQGNYNLGVAHGVPGVIAMLGGACAAAVAKARPLLDGAVTWLLSQNLPDEAESRFSTWRAPDIKPTVSRSAWCYGDPGIAASLLYAARCVGEQAWEDETLKIARAATKRPPDKAGVVDAGLCHGAAGLGHIYNRMFQATGEEFLKEAAQFWFKRTLELRRPDQGIAGFAAWMPGQDGNMQWVEDPGVLNGAAGIALALLAAATPADPVWDRMLLISVPPRVT